MFDRQVNLPIILWNTTCNLQDPWDKLFCQKWHSGTQLPQFGLNVLWKDMKTLSRITPRGNQNFQTQRTSKNVRKHTNTVKQQPIYHHNSNLKTINYHQDSIIIKTSVIICLNYLFYSHYVSETNNTFSSFLAHKKNKNKWSWSISAIINYT